MLVLDEPINGLDAKSAKSFYSLIKKLNRENGLTIVMVSHSIDRVIDYASHIVYLKDRLEFAGTKEDFLASEYVKNFKLEDRV